MRLLVLAPFAPRTDALHGGSRALAATIAALGERHEVAVVHLPDERGVDDPVRDAAALVEELPAPDVSGARRLAVYGSLVVGRPAAVSERVGTAAIERLRTIVAQFRPDVVQLEFLLTAGLLPALDEGPRVLVDHDATLRPLEQFDHLPSPVAGVLRTLDARAWTALAKRAAGAVDAVVVFTERDRSASELAERQDIRVIPLVVPPRARPLDAEGTEPPTVLFVGYYRHPPNADAAAWLVDEIFPRVRALHDDARLALVGDELPPAIAARAGEGVEVVGRVDDLDSYLDRAAVVVAPIRSGGGTRVKVLEALGAGKAVVATPRAAEGIEGSPLVIASSTEDLAREIAALLAAGERRRSLGAASYAWATGELDGRRTADSFDAVYADIVRR